MQRSHALIHTLDQWYRVSHENTSIHEGAVQLDWVTENHAHSETEVTNVIPVPLSMDPWCRLYRWDLHSHMLKRYRWDERNKPDSCVSLFTSQRHDYGDFSPNDINDLAHLDIRDLCITDQGYLVLADAGTPQLLIFDIDDNRLVRRLQLDAVPLALTKLGTSILCLLQRSDGATELLSVTPQADPVRVEIQQPIRLPARLTATVEGKLLVLEGAGQQSASIHCLSIDTGKLSLSLSVAHATDIAVTTESTLVVARKAGADFLCFDVNDWTELPQLNARQYQGDGIVSTGDAKIAYWTPGGFRLATLARLRYLPHGRLVSFRLDSGEFQMRWGQVYIDACIPSGCSVVLQAITADEDLPGAPKFPSQLPANVLSNVELLRPDLAPMPPAAWVPDADSDDGDAQTLHHRWRGNESAWHCHGNGFETYEAPVIAPPGRYLWLVMQLRGKSRVTPRIKSVRVQYPAQNLLRRLPRHYSVNEQAGSFLERYLAIAHGGLAELDQLSRNRHALLDPDSTPASLLPWLGRVLGLDIDHRWSETAQRNIIKEAMWLYRFRGTVAGLKRFIELYLEREVVLIEHFKVRGLGGVFVSNDDSLTGNMVVGAGYRVGGQIGQFAAQSVEGLSVQDAISTHAHKFSVLVPVPLDAEQRAVVEHILDVHRPAHTVVDVCSIDSGMRVGTGLHLGISSMVGASAGFGRWQIGRSVLGRTDVIGTPDRAGFTAGNAAIGKTTRVT